MLTNGVKAELLKEQLKAGGQKSGMLKDDKELMVFGDKAAKTSSCRTSESYLVSAQSTLFGNNNDCCPIPSSGSWNDSSLFAQTLNQYNNERYNENMRLYSTLYGSYGTGTCDNTGFWSQFWAGAAQGLVGLIQQLFSGGLAGSAPAAGSAAGKPASSGGTSKTSFNGSVNAGSSSAKKQVDSEYKGEKAVEDAVDAQNTAIEEENKYNSEANKHGETLKAEKSKLSDLKTKINALNNTGENYLEKYMEAKMEYEKNQSEIKMQNQIVKDQQNIIDDCDKRINEKTTEKNNIENNINKNLKPALNSLNSQLQNLKDQLERLKENPTTNEAAIINIEGEIEQKELEIKQKEAEIKAEEAKIERLNKEIEAIEKTKTTAVNKQSDAQTKLTAAKGKSAKLKSDMEKADQRNEITAQSIKDIQGEIDTVTENIVNAESAQKLALSRANDQRQRCKEAETSESAAKREVDKKRKAQEDVTSKGLVDWFCSKV